MAKQIFAILLVFTFLWGGGFFAQKSFNASRSTDFHIKYGGTWVLILGLRPKQDRVYLRFAFVQILAWLFLFVGILAVYWGKPDLLRNLLGLLSLAIICGAVLIFLLDMLHR